MDKVQIIGIGIISRAGTSIEEVWNSLDGKTAIEKREGRVAYVSSLPAGKRRRMNRYSDMTVYVSSEALKDGKIAMDDLDAYRIGTIFSTGYGPMESNLSFAKMALEEDPDLCSPTIFANTVSNACIGHVCVNLGCKGVSTIVMGSNSIGYSQMLMDKGDADYILSGSVEEYNEALYQCFRQNPYAADIDIGEAAVGLLLAKGEHKGAYCRLVDFLEYNLGEYPLINKVEKEDIKQGETALKNFLSRQGQQIDAVFSAGNGSYFDEYEKELLENVLGGSVIYADRLKEYTGETLGSSFSVAIAVAAVCLKKGAIPEKLVSVKKEKREIKTALVTGYDVTGNYMVYFMEGV